MSRLATRDSNRSGYSSSYRTDRARSGSPSEYYRHQIGKKEQLFDKVYDLKLFINNGIEKFLDKQAVRDLITAYDNDDIFVKGETEFFKSYDEELSRRNSAPEDDDDQSNTDSSSRNFLAIPEMTNSSDRKKFQNFAGKVNDMVTIVNRINRAEYPNSNAKSMAVFSFGGGIRPRRKSTLFTTFLSMIRIKLFKVKRNKSAARRRESEFFNQTMGNLNSNN